MKRWMVLMLTLLALFSFGNASANGPNKAIEHCPRAAHKAAQLNAAEKKALAKEFAVFGEFQGWVEANDLAEAEKVFKKLKTDEKRQEAIDLLANKYMGKGDFKSATRWVDKIKDEECRLKAVEGISTEAFRFMMKQLRSEFLSAADFIAAEETLGYIKYPARREGATYYLVIKSIHAGDFARAEAWTHKITDNEKKQLALYNLAVEGYAARGEMDKAFATLDKELAPLFGTKGENRAVPKRPHILKDMMIAAVVNKYGLDEAVARGNAVKVLAKIGDIYYGLMALETAVLNAPSDKAAEALLADAGYLRVGDPTSEETDTDVGTLAVVSYSKDAGATSIIFVKYGIEAAGPRPFQVDRWLAPEKQREFDALIKDDEQLKKYLAEQKKAEEEQKLAVDSEQDFGEKYQKFLEDPTDRNNRFMAPDPAVPQGDHGGHNGHGGMHH